MCQECVIYYETPGKLSDDTCIIRTNQQITILRDSRYTILHKNVKRTKFSEIIYKSNCLNFYRGIVNIQLSRMLILVIYDYRLFMKIKIKNKYSAESSCMFLKNVL